jgi:hypothetical protein
MVIYGGLMGTTNGVAAGLAGYSATPLSKKLGYKAGFRACVKSAPDHYLEIIHPLPANVAISNRFQKDVDLCHFFTMSRSKLESELPKLLGIIRQNGMIWVSWPKKASKVPTDITENVIRSTALPLGLVDVKVCAVDDVWSGLKLVIRKELRT